MQTSDESAPKPPVVDPAAVTLPTEAPILVPKTSKLEADPLPPLRAPLPPAKMQEKAVHATQAQENAAKIKAITDLITPRIVNAGLKEGIVQPLMLAIRRIQGMTPGELARAIEREMPRSLRVMDPDVIVGKGTAEREHFGVAARARLFHSDDLNTPTSAILDTIVPLARMSLARDEHTLTPAILCLLAPLFFVEMYRGE